MRLVFQTIFFIFGFNIISFASEAPETFVLTRNSSQFYSSLFKFPSDENKFCSYFSANRSSTLQINSKAFIYLPKEGPDRTDGAIDIILYSDSCNGRDFFAYADVDITSIIKRLPRKSKPLEELKHRDLIFEIRFTGQMQLEVMPTFGELGWLRASVRIDQILSLRNDNVPRPMPDFLTPAPIMSTGNRLRELSIETVLSFFGRGLQLHVLRSLLSSKAIVHAFGSQLTENDLASFTQNALPGTFDIKIASAQICTDGWTVNGKVKRMNLTIPSRNENKEYYNFSIRYSVDHDAVLITRLELTKTSPDPFKDISLSGV